MKNPLCRALPLAFLAISAPAGAAPLGLALELRSTSSYEAVFELTNTSSAAQLVDFGFSIGDTAFNFDSVRTDDGNGAFSAIDSGGRGIDPASGIAYSVSGPDGNARGGARSDRLDFRFANFSAGRSFRFATDIDRDGGNSAENFRRIFFDNGNASNSLVTAVFSTGDTLRLALSENPPAVDPGAAATRFSFALSGPLRVVPEPWSPGLLMLGMLLLHLATRRGKSPSGGSVARGGAGVTPR